MPADLKALREQLAAAESEAAREIERDATASAYAREKAATMQRLARLRSLDPDVRFVVRCSLSAADMPEGAIGILGPSVADLVAGAEANLTEIDAELERLDGEL